MAESLTIARPYAEAAFRIAEGAGTAGPWSDALARLAAVADSKELHGLLGDPALSKAQLAALICDVAGDLDVRQKNFVGLLAENERLRVLPQIAEVFEALRNAREGVIDARVASAYPLSDAQIAELVATLEARYGRKVKITVDIEPDLIGGVSIRIGDQVTDVSVRGKLAQLEAALKG
ncbi:MAG: F0F1 ATP synthase subunit delta [Burkholderiales bacterium]|nr:MAG: F0F1 ATP synthase subunit delta [Burkholderiales bacterium]